MKKLYVGNLTFNTSETDLRDEFARYGQVASVKILHDAVTHQPRGFGFVEMPNDDEAASAIVGLNGSNLGGRTIVVNEARPRAEHHESKGRPAGGLGRERRYESGGLSVATGR